MNPKAYPLEKRLKISQRPSEEIVKFVLEVSPNLLYDFAQRFPPVDGFRRGHHNELLMRIRRFLNRMHLWDDKEWMFFRDLWIDWIKSHPQLDTLLSKYDNSADFTEGAEKTPPNSHLDIKCFEYLTLKSEESRVPRELIKRFYEFGYFQEDPSIEHYIAMAKSATELKLFELPAEIENVRVQLGQLKSSVKALSNRLDATVRDSEKALGLVDSIAKVDKTLQETLNKTRDLLQDNLNLHENIRQLQQDLEKLDRVYNSLESTLTDMLTHMFDQKYTQLKSDLIREMEGIRDRFNATVDSLRQEVNDLRNEVKQKEQEVVKDRFPLEVLKSEKVIAVEDLSVTASIEKLNTPDKFASALSENFRNIGMQSVAAQVLAGEVLAALAAGQIVLFRGSMASIITKVCARTLAGPSIRMIYIPIGLLDGREFSASLHRVLEDSRDKTWVSAFILEGINLSAVEVYAGSLRQLISERFLSLESTGRNLILLGTIVDGPGALDFSPELCEWGPIFHTDCLEWRERWSHCSISAGFVPSEVWEVWISTVTDIPDDWEEIYKDYSHLGGNATVLWRRCLYTAAARLNGMTNEGNVPTLTQSLVFGWLLPRGFASRVNLTDYENLLAGGRVDASKADERIVKLLGFLNR